MKTDWEKEAEKIVYSDFMLKYPDDYCVWLVDEIERFAKEVFEQGVEEGLEKGMREPCSFCETVKKALFESIRAEKEKA